MKGRMKSLRVKAIQRKQHPTQKIDAIIRLKKRTAKMGERKGDLLLAKRASNELIFAKNKQKEGYKYAGAGKATISSTELATKFARAKRMIHTHPLVVTGKKVRQVPTPSIADLVTMFSTSKKVSMVAVPEKKGASRVAGYLAVRRTKKSEKVLRAIQEKKSKFGKETAKNKTNPNYWTTFLNLLNQKEYGKIRSNTKLVKTFESIREKAQSLNQLKQNQKTANENYQYKLRELRHRYGAGQIDQITYSKEIARITQENEASKTRVSQQIEQLNKNINSILKNSKYDLSDLHTWQTFLEIGLVQAISTEGNSPNLKHIGFFKAKPTTPVDEKTIERARIEKEQAFKEYN